MVFYKEKTLEQMSEKEWEMLCDHCGRCCLLKLEDEDTGEFIFTDVRCKLLDEKTGLCKDYEGRRSIVPDCIKLTPKNVNQLGWIPKSCAYLKLARGEDLACWHPLVAGDDVEMKKNRVSISKRFTACPDAVEHDELVNHIVEWPNLDPNKKK